MKKKDWAFLYNLPMILGVYVPFVILVLQYHNVPLIEFSTLKYFSAIFLMIVGVLLLVLSYRSLIKDGEADLTFSVKSRKLVTSGPYRYVRNPMYLGILVLVVGESLYFSSVPLFVFAVLIAFSMVYYVAHFEEFALANQFGQEYIDYKMDVNAWLPRRSMWKSLKNK